ncbi:MAG: efflux RND transporter periplasmic adaptor subunit [Planctomycetes bacterium]|nr:efflux RND transporter periplasmic adaptor subunit [Planctomycetota bacterium]MBL7040215.1 efflux RND transporter periplasmic adaptor subunit [Pirellulaceae bacterium]
MDTSRQRKPVLLISIGVTAFLVGAVVSGLTVWRVLHEQIRTLEIAQSQRKQHGNSDSETNGQHPAALVRVATAEWKPVQPLKPIIGRLVEVRKVTVASEVEGQVVEMPVEEGTPVVGGETILARVDDVWNRLAIDRGKSRVASIRAKTGYESAELKRLEQLADRNAITGSELDAKRALLEQFVADLAEAQATVQEEEERKTRSVIHAPFDGTIIAKHAELGERLSPGTPVVDIISRGTIDAQIMVPESLIDLVGIDQVAQVQIDPLGEILSGKVVSITPYGVSASRSFPVRVRLDDQEGRLKVGMSVTVMVATAPKEPALVVSKDAVLVRPDGSTVWIVVRNEASRPDEVQPIPVVVHARLRSEYAIEPETLKGRELLVPEAQVVIEGAEHLQPGQHVRIVTLDENRSDGASRSDGPVRSKSTERHTDRGTSERER